MQLTIPPFYTMQMMRLSAELEAQGLQIDHLEVGQPIAPAPIQVTSAAINLLDGRPLQYCSALGVYELRHAIAKHYANWYGLTIKPESVVITPGSSLALYIALLANFKRGDRIAIASPSYPCYRNVIQSLGYELIEIQTDLEDNYLINLNVLADIADQIDGLLIASPNNPTGSVYDESSLRDLSRLCEKHNIRIISDELYHGITYEYDAETILKYNRDAIVISGFSKYFAMTGWRIGWMIVDDAVESQYESLLQNMILCTSPLPQIAAIEAFNNYELLDGYVEGYRKSRNLLYSALVSAGFTRVYKPNGAFYLYLELDGVTADSLHVCKDLLQKEHVAISPGMDFSANPQQCAVRISFAQKWEVIERALPKLIRYLSALKYGNLRQIA